MAISKVVKPEPDGHIAIPEEFREALGLGPDDEVRLTLLGRELRLQPASEPEGSLWAVKLYELFAPVRNSLRDYSEQEINDAIDEAIKAARKRE